MTATLHDIDLVLGSTSRYRRELLSRLTTRFRVMAPDVDETPLPNEPPLALATRLADTKAMAVAEKSRGAVVIGSDQVADLNGTALGKPGSIDNAVRQLQACSGQAVLFHSALCAVDARTSQMKRYAAFDTTRVRFRRLDDAEIRRYVEAEQPLDCAGAFKAEGLGIALFENIESNDPTGLIGLPMIALCDLLRRIGLQVI